MQVLQTGRAPYLPVDPDAFRAYVRDHKQRSLTPRLMSPRDAVARFVADGDYLAYDCNYFQRGPSTLIREVIRQQKKDLWICGKFTYVDVGLLAGAGCASRADCGFFWPGAAIDNRVKDGRLQVYEYSNVVMTLRLQAGAMGLPFLPVRSFGGTDGFDHSGCKLVEDPFTGGDTYHDQWNQQRRQAPACAATSLAEVADPRPWGFREELRAVVCGLSNGLGSATSAFRRVPCLPPIAPPPPLTGA